MATENRLTTRTGGGDSSLPRVGGVAGDNDNEDEKVYYGFGVFMGLPLADLKAMKDDFVEQQALTGGPPRHAPPPLTAMERRTNHLENGENRYDRQGDIHMAPPHAQQQQQQQQQQLSSRMNGGYECQRSQDQQREYTNERDTRFAQGSATRDEDDNSDGSDEFGNKSHSLNFILH